MMIAGDADENALCVRCFEQFIDGPGGDARGHGRDGFAGQRARRHELSHEEGSGFEQRAFDNGAFARAIAFAQCDENGVPFAPSAQPAAVDYPSYVPAFIGYAHLLRRDAFVAAGGFRERLGINGEEKELSLRLLDAGMRVVYLPGARIGHVAAAAGRDERRYLHQTVRNNTVSSLYDEPFPLVLAGTALRLYSYYPMRRGWKVHDPGGFGQIVRGLAGELPQVLRERRPVRRTTWAAWRRMTTSEPEPYTPPAAVPTVHPEAGA